MILSRFTAYEKFHMFSPCLYGFPPGFLVSFLSCKLPQGVSMWMHGVIQSKFFYSLSIASARGSGSTATLTRIKHSLKMKKQHSFCILLFPALMDFCFVLMLCNLRIFTHFLLHFFYRSIFVYLCQVRSVTSLLFNSFFVLFLFFPLSHVQMWIMPL